MKYSIGILTFLFMMLLSPEHFSQQAYLLEGYVIDAENELPLQGVNVFLNNTTLGDATNREGKYSIDFVPSGSYDLIVSMIGYEKVTKRVTIPSDEAPPVIKLKPLIYDLDEIQVEGVYTDIWQENLERFTHLLLGESENSEDCRIVNPEVLEFNTADGLKAVNREWLLIDNNAIGYRLKCFINNFHAQKTGELRYSLETYFIEMEPENDSQLEEWIENRQRTYRGSMKHFFWAMMHNRLFEEGFSVRRTMYPAYTDMKGEDFHSDVMFEFSIPDSVDYYEKTIDYDGYMLVIYTPEQEPYEYYSYRLSHGSSIGGMVPKMSWIHFPFGNVTVNSYGNILDDIRAPKVFGYWAWLRIADTLPLDYLPRIQ